MDTTSVDFNAMCYEAKRVFTSHTLIEEQGDRWTLHLEDAAYYVVRGAIVSHDDARALLIQMIDAIPDWYNISRDSKCMIAEASGWVMLSQDLFVGFCQIVLIQDPVIKHEVEKRSRQKGRTPRELARIKSVLKI
jgi:hypothetical protein